jgi:very-short-patch-repair endonuclease
MDPLILLDTFGIDFVLTEQRRVLRRDQALAAGFTAAQIGAALRRARWQRLLPRVYLTEAAEPTFAQRVLAAWLWAGTESLIAGAAAAWWHEITALEPRTIDVIVPMKRAMSLQPGIRIIRANVPPQEAIWRDGIRTTSPARTCLDMIRWREGDLIEDALLARRLQVEKLPPSLRRSARRRGQRRARAAVQEVTAAPWSKAERRAHQVSRDAGITGWVANRRAVTLPPTVFPDIAFEDVKLAVEIDGRRFHDRASDAEAWERDHDRELALVRAGWTVVRVTYRQLVEQPEKIIQAIREILDRLRREAVSRSAAY